jgi:hypothetical protein
MIENVLDNCPKYGNDQYTKDETRFITIFLKLWPIQILAMGT